MNPTVAMTGWNLFEFSGIGLGAALGASIGLPFGLAAAAGSGLVGASAGFGISWLHARFVCWIVGPETPEADVMMTRGKAWIISEYVYAFAMLAGLFCSWFGTFLTLAFLFDSRLHEPPELSRAQSVALCCSTMVCGYVVLWATQKIMNW